MTMLNKMLLTILGILFSFVSLHGAETNSSVKVSTPDNWWKKGSYDYPATNQLLWHVEGSVAYSKSEGNLDMKDTSYGLKAKIRKNHIGVSFSYDKVYSNSVLHNADNTDTTIIVDQYEANTLLGYDINKNFFTLVGYNNARDTTFEIYNKTTKYVGLGYRTNHKKHYFNIFAALGREDISFGTYPKLPSGETDGKYYEINYNTTIFDDKSFDFRYSYFMGDAAYRDTSKLYVSLSIPLYQKLSVVLGYKENYIEAQELVDRIQSDKTTYTAIKFQF
ncbi:MAG: Unknown protein [uncultured Sulfurovum sp.]|uniref:DUF481 domain-containing protein n=1 Tax=uncultured Sulfurovum sp. TaxID=269237 RepID=A0A6S6S385_9BACT|nr:MAG: Unknown protein [uncultured Sulfurovum sp.]